LTCQLKQSIRNHAEVHPFLFLSPFLLMPRILTDFVDFYMLVYMSFLIDC